MRLIAPNADEDLIFHIFFTSASKCFDQAAALTKSGTKEKHNTPILPLRDRIKT